MRYKFHFATILYKLGSSLWSKIPTAAPEGEKLDVNTEDSRRNSHQNARLKGRIGTSKLANIRFYENEVVLFPRWGISGGFRTEPSMRLLSEQPAASLGQPSGISV